MSRNTSLTTATATNYQPTWKKGARLMLIKRIFLALLITGVIGISTAATQAQSTRWRTWVRGNSVSNVIPGAPDQAVESAQVAEIQTAAKELKGEKKTAIVGSWQGTVGGGNRAVATFNSDGTAQGSVQSEVSTIPEFGVLTPTHGVWEYLGGRQFGLTLVGLIYDINTGADLGTLKVRVLLTLNATGDQMSGTDKVEIFDPDGELVFTASGDVSYTRIKFEPFN
jgi:hypothetical protein